MTQKHTQACPIAGFLNIFGDNWTWLIIREAFYGSTRFKEFQENTGIAKNLLTKRLENLVAEGILQKRDIGERGTRYAYELTSVGKSVFPVLISMFQWSTDNLYTSGEEPVLLFERGTDKPLRKIAVETREGTPLRMRDCEVRPGPGATAATAERLRKISA